MNFRQLTYHYARPLWTWYLIGVFFLILVNYVAIEIPQIVKNITDALTTNQSIDKLESWALLVVGLGSLMLFIRAISRILVFWPGRKIEANLKQDLFSRLISLPQSFFFRHGMGDLISRMANDVNQIRVLYAFALLQLVNMILLIFLAMTKMISTSPLLTAASIFPLGLMIFITRYAMPKMQQYSKFNQEALGRLTNRVTEAFVNVHVIQANTAEKSFADLAHVENQSVFDSNMKLIVIRTLIFPLMGSLASLSLVITMLLGGYMAIDGKITVGDILAFNIYIGLLTFPLTALGIILGVYQRAKTALVRISEIQDTEPEVQPTHVVSPVANSVLLEVKNLNFEFEKAEEDSTRFKLENVSFKLEPQQHLGIFGPIGSGKSVLFDLITRIQSPQPGAIFLQGVDINDLSPQYLRRQIAYASQSVHLFSDTIRNNLTFGLDNVTQEELEAAAKKAQILNDIEKFEMGWETEVGEKGVRLSGGQKQRLALARILIRKPQIIILDDVLSAVDHTTEQLLIETIQKIECSVIIASHRASALEHCDQILILDKGKITKTGTFEQLSDIINSVSEGDRT